MLALTAMLESQDAQQFDAAASAIAELANPDNRAFQVSVALDTLLKHILQVEESMCCIAGAALPSSATMSLAPWHSLLICRLESGRAEA